MTAGLILGQGFLAAVTGGGADLNRLFAADNRLVIPVAASLVVTNTQYVAGGLVLKSPGWDCFAPTFVWSGAYGTPGGLVALGNDTLLEGVIIEINDVKTPLKFGGSTSGIVPNNGFLKNDADDTIIIPANTFFRLLWCDKLNVGENRATTGPIMLASSEWRTASGRGEFYGQSATSQLSAIQINTNSNISTPGSQSAASPPIAMVAKRSPSITAQDGVLLVGDSIAWGTGQYSSPYAVTPADLGAVGYPSVALASDTGGRRYRINFAIPGTRCSDLLLGGGSEGGSGSVGFSLRNAILQALGMPFHKIYSEMGGNSFNNGSAATIGALLQSAIWRNISPPTIPARQSQRLWLRLRMMWIRLPATIQT